MDAHSFRVLCTDLVPFLEGARVMKVYGPLPHTIVLLLQMGPRKVRLVCSTHTAHPAFFVTHVALPNPQTPRADVMCLRKYIGGKRLGRGVAHFASRRLAVPVLGAAAQVVEGTKARTAAKGATPGAGDYAAPVALAAILPTGADAGAERPLWLVLDLREGISLAPALPEGMAEPPLWPPAEVVAGLCELPHNSQKRRDGPEDSGPWQQYSLLTPLLRETLAALECPEAQALMIDLEAEGDALFYYGKGGLVPQLYSAWPLPPAVAARRKLEEMPAPFLAAALFQSQHSPHEVDDVQDTFGADEASQDDSHGAEEGKRPWLWRLAEEGGLVPCPMLSLASAVEEQAFLAAIEQRQERQQAEPGKKQAKKEARLRTRLEEERTRLEGLLALRETAKCLQEHLWRFGAEEKQAVVVLPMVQEECMEERTIALNPLLTVRENMAHMFRQSARGARGLAFLEARLRGEAVAMGPGPGKKGATPAAKGAFGPGNALQQATKMAGQDAGKAMRPTAHGLRDALQEKHVACFVSSDGYAILRGKNAQGNQRLLKLGQPYDYWLHSQGGPSAHAIIRRKHSGEELPETTLQEAAVLVGLKSWQSEDAKADIMVAELRHVRSPKGSATGAVHVDKTLRSMVVALDATLEATLAALLDD
ncbi:NFACT RNA binding domain-containing protein [Desulfovibrio cuneatus]|uniref:NFACT RNA binding domain-containing protein n=1 Tax=Desulfovibrio cuneatus TaxID=159728 RepID=UPI00040FBCCA|nr:NFACT RNA binding domain-containing protein [Desulfovibrio cuneatus]